MLTNDHDYKTSDLCLATTLSFWWQIDQIDKTDPRRAVFYFKSSPELLDRVQLYYSEQLQCSPLAFSNQLRMVKSRLYERS